MRRVIWQFSAIIEATEQQADQAHDAIGRALCPDEDHPGPCDTPWMVVRTRFDELEGADKARWEASFDHDRAGQETSTRATVSCPRSKTSSPPCGPATSNSPTRSRRER